MSKEMREQIDRVKNWKQFLNENTSSESIKTYGDVSKRDRIKNFELGKFNFHVYSIETEDGNVRGIEITDAFVGTEKIGFNEKLSITFTDTNLIEEEKFKRENIKNINNLKDMCEFILNEINNSKQK